MAKYFRGLSDIRVFPKPFQAQKAGIIVNQAYGVDYCDQKVEFPSFV